MSELISRSGIVKEYALTLDIKQPVQYENIELVEGDTRNRFVISLMDGDKTVDLTGCRVILVFSHKDGTVYQDSYARSSGIMINENKITVTLATESVKEGMVECEIQIYGTDGYALTTTPRFSFLCRRGLLDDESVVSDSSYTQLLGLIEQANQAISLAQSAIVSANVALESATATGEISLEVYLHVRYCDRDPSENAYLVQLSQKPDQYVGLCVSNSQIAPVEAQEYVWYRWRGNDGADGTSSHVHIRYSAQNPLTMMQGVPLQTTPADYMGIAVSTSETASEDALDYSWYRIRGEAGLSVNGASVNASGELELQMSNATTINAGRVTGEQGVSVRSATINAAGELILTLSNRSTINAGLVCGTDGEHIESVQINDAGELLVTLSNGKELNAGVTGGSISAINIDSDGMLKVVMRDNSAFSAGRIATSVIEANSAIPITSGAVHAAIGNVETLLANI